MVIVGFHICLTFSFLVLFFHLPIVLFCSVMINLRYYPKDYVREFMAESVSYLLRKASIEQLKRGMIFFSKGILLF